MANCSSRLELDRCRVDIKLFPKVPSIVSDEMQGMSGEIISFFCRVIFLTIMCFSCSACHVGKVSHRNGREVEELCWTTFQSGATPVLILETVYCNHPSKRQ